MRLLKVLACLLCTVQISSAQVVSMAYVNHIEPNGVDSLGSIYLTVSGGTPSYSFYWTPGGYTSQNITGKTKKQYAVKIKDNVGDSVTYAYNMGYKVKWGDLYGTTLHHDTLVNSSAYGWASAVSKNTLAANTNGWIEQVMQGSSNYQAIGFLDSISPISYYTGTGTFHDIDHGLYKDGNNLYVLMNGSYLYLGQSAQGDVLRIERSHDTVYYKKNGIMLWSVRDSVATRRDWKVKAVVNQAGIPVCNVGCSFSQLGHTSLPNYVKLIPSVIHSSGPGISDGSVSLQPRDAVSCTYTWSPAGTTGNTLASKGFGTYALTVQDSLMHTNNYHYNIGYKVKWGDLYGTTLHHDTLLNNSAYGWASAMSKNTLAANTNGWIEQVMQGSSNYQAIGFLDSISPISYYTGTGTFHDIDHGLYKDGNNLYVLMNGSYLYLGQSAEGDVLRIERGHDTIYYKQNGTMLWSVRDSAGTRRDWKVKAVVNQAGVPVANVGCSFSQLGHTSLPNYVKLIPSVIHSSGPGISDGSVSLQPRDAVSCTYTWSPGGTTGNKISQQGLGTYTLTVQDSLMHTGNYPYHIGYKVKWGDLYGTTLYHDTLVNSSTYGWASAVSKNTLAANTNGWIEQVMQGSSNYQAIGFLDSTSSAYNYSNNGTAYYDIDYGLYKDGNNLYVLMNGSYLYLGQSAEGDVLRIERGHDTIYYKQNGFPLWATIDSVTSRHDWKVKAVVNRAGVPVANVGCSFSTPLSIAIAKQSASYEDLRSGMIAVVPYGGTAPYAITLNGAPSAAVIPGLSPGDYTVTVTDSSGDITGSVVSIGISHNWRLQQHVTMQQDTFSVAGDSTGHLVSYNTLFSGEDGWTEITIGKKNQSFAFGFIGGSGTDNDANYSVPYLKDAVLNKRLSFADSLVANLFAGTSYTANPQFALTHLVSFRNGVATALFKGSARAAIPYSDGDVFKLRRSGGLISLEKNGQTVAKESSSSDVQNLVSAISIGGASQAILISPSSYAPSNDFFHHASPIFDCSGDYYYNWTYSRSFDENGFVKDEARQYMDGLGRTIQSQSRVFSKNNTLVSAPIYDAFGRAVGQSLPAPSYNAAICFVYGFITNTSGSDYSYLDHDQPLSTNAPGELYNPKPVDNTTQGTLGWYYSNNNSSEPLVAASQYPYSRVEYYNDPLGRPKKAGGVGADHKMGSGHETKYIYASTTNQLSNFSSNELAYVFPNQTYEMAPDFTTPNYGISGQSATVRNQNLTLYKTIMLNADGKDQISYTNAAGQVVATCVTGDGSSGCGQNVPVVQNLGTAAGSFGVQVYIPLLKTGTLIIYDATSSTPQSITPVLRDLLGGNTLVAGTDYTYNSTSGAVTFAGAYAGTSGNANRSLYLDVSYSAPAAPATGHQFLVTYNINYMQWSLYFYDRKGRLLANVAPNDVVCQVPPVLTQRTQYHGKPATTCDNSNPDVVAMDLKTGSGTNEALLLIRPEAFQADTSAIADHAYDPVYKPDSTRRRDDSLFFAGLSVLPRDSSAIIVLDTSSTNRLHSISDSAYRVFAASFNKPPVAFGGKRISYTGQYRLYADSSSTPLPQVIPFDFSVDFDNNGTPTVTNRRPFCATRLSNGDVRGVSRLRLRTQNVAVTFEGLGGTGGPFQPCNGSISMTQAIQRVANGIFQHVGIAANISVLSYGTPNPLQFYTTYTYDEYDRLIASNTQDEGHVDYLYDQKEDKLFFTQNDKQRANGGKFSALLYDKLGRVVQTGEYDPQHGGPTSGGEQLQFQTYTDYFKNAVPPTTGYVSVGTYAAANVSPFTWGHLFERNTLVYDTLDAALPNEVSNYNQHYTAAKVSKSWNDHDTTWYSYDDLGRQAWSVQYLDGLNAYKTMNYTYNLRGQLLRTDYQKNTSADKFTHLYSYDADERLGSAYIKRGTSSIPYTVAAYEYYLHGPLKRSVLGNSLQGLDYVYTIGGQLKSLNNPMASSASQDPGQDGYASGPNSNVKADVFGYTLDYYTNDYLRTGSPITAYNGSSYSGQNNSYAGLLKSTRWKTTLPSGVTDDYSGAARMYEYNYNDLYQFSGATFGTAALSSGNVAFTAANDYGLGNITYDNNGNMKALKRYKKAVSGAVSLLDDLSYNYHGSKTNRLLQVQDAATTSGIAPDMDLPNQTSSTNYTYNEIGELTGNAQEDQGFEYNASGLCTRVYRQSNNNNIATYTYNDKGQRHSKTSYDNTGTAVKATYYVYDAGGMQVAAYEQDLTTSGSSPALKDLTVYAAGRLGLYEDRASKVFYELSDHLGNIRTVVTETSGNAEVVSFTDYYPHGGVMPGQNYVNASPYRYNYQGQEKDVETGLVNFELRQYDPRLGRWYNPDPMGQHHSPYLAMGNNPVSMADPNGGQDGTPFALDFMLGFFNYLNGNSYDGVIIRGQQGLDSRFTLSAQNYGHENPFTAIYAQMKDNLINQAMQQQSAAMQPIHMQTIQTGLNTPVPEEPEVTAARKYYEGMDMLADIRNEREKAAFAEDARSAWRHGWYDEWFSYKIKSVVGDNFDKKSEETLHPYVKVVADVNPLMNGAHIVNGLATGNNAYGEKMSKGDYAIATIGIFGLGELEGGGKAAYSVAYEVKLDVQVTKASRATHFREANKSLLSAMDANPEFSKMMNDLIPGIRGDIMGARGGAKGISPSNWTWHHASEPGLMQLVPRDQHTSSLFQSLFHPGGVGGYSIWGR